MSDRAAPAWLTQWEYAHRGLHSAGVPENSMAAAEAAIAAGMAIECDVQRSFDDEVLVFHDWELERLTGHVGRVEDRVASEIAQKVLLGSDQSPLLLSDYLARVDGRVPLLIEIKSEPGYDVEWSCLKARDALADYDGDFAVMSFDPRVPAWFAHNAPEFCRGLVCTDTLDIGWLSAWRKPGAIAQADPDFLAMDIRDLPEEMTTAWRDAGKPLLSWTVRSPELRAHALAHVDALISEGEGLA
jgi:glycerophosphoryl diester phosphodiesterase